MSQPKLLSSQELSLLQLNAEQCFSPMYASPFARQTPTLMTGASPTFTPAPGGGCSTAAVAIARPGVRLRSEWVDGLSDVAPFTLPTHFLGNSSSGGGSSEKVALRYAVDAHDLEWIRHMLTRQSRVSMSDEAAATNGLATQLETVITLLELEALNNPQQPPEALTISGSSSVARLDASVVEEMRLYWLRKRAALGGRIPCIPTIHMMIKDDGEPSPCTTEVVGDCPLPFRCREWSVPVLLRKKSQRRARSPTMETLDSYEKLLHNVVDMTQEMVHREELRQQHVSLSLYELATLRQLAMTPDEAVSKGQD